jgi:hypothetical protein
MTATGDPVPTTATRRSGSLALSALGLVVGLLGAAWWVLDADPVLGQVLLVLGAAVAIAGRAIAPRLGPRGERLLLIVVAVVALVVVVDAVHLVQVVIDQRASQLA